ncbi:MAG: hypothetical protein PHS07_03275 [Patescibacteria group bacterium]|nr:hypothetical protein [Patescibacteria group bacterium]
MPNRTPTLQDIQGLFKFWEFVPPDFFSRELLEKDIKNSFEKFVSGVHDSGMLNDLWVSTPDKFKLILDQRLKELEE